MPVDDFSEIGHCGGQYTIHIQGTKIAFGYRHSRPGPMSAFCVYALPNGIPLFIAPINNLPQIQGAHLIFIASDSEGNFGHECPKCKGYWRSSGAPYWKITCPYCGMRDQGHIFLTDGQRKYIDACCDKIADAIDSGVDGEHVFDLDEIADAVFHDGEKPKFYYSEVTQQNRFNCVTCNKFNDILGRYGFCSTCGTENGIQELNREVDAALDNSNNESCLKDLVSAFDGYARHITKLLVSNIPMTKKRKNIFTNMKFHNIERCTEEMTKAFDIDIFKGFNSKNRNLVVKMFHRRHIYEHNGGEVDQKYIADTCDTSVKVKQRINETRESVLELSVLVKKLATNLNEGYHSIFPPEETALKVLCN